MLGINDVTSTAGNFGLGWSHLYSRVKNILLCYGLMYELAK